MTSAATASRADRAGGRRGAPAACSRSSPCSRRSAPRWRCGSSRARRPTRSSGTRSDAYQATERYRERFGDHAIVVLVRGDAAAARADRQPRPAARARGLPVGQQARRPAAPGGAGLAVRGSSRATKPVQVVYGPGTFINSAVGEIHDQLAAQLQATGGARRSGRRDAARRLAQAQGRSKAQQDRLARRGRAARLRRSSRATCCSSTLKYGLGLTGAAAARRPRLRLRARVRPGARRDARRRRASPTCSRRRSRR